MDIADKVAIVTGGASGIGYALAQALGQRGARIVLADLDSARLAEAAESLTEEGHDVAGVVVDVTDRDAVRELADRVVELHGGADIVCNNAGVATFGPISQATRADWEFTMGVNFWGVVNGIEAFLPLMLSRGGGHFVNTASMSGLVGMGYLGVYCASKFAVVGLSESLARELEPAGIGVTIVCPMVVDTPINEHSASMRPPELRNPGDHPVTDPAPLVGGVVSADEVAGRVVAAIQENELYVLTHSEQRDILARRAARLDRAGARVGGGD